MTTSLSLTIEHLYEVFSSYIVNPIDLRAYSCDCCVDDDEIRKVTMKPLKELTEQALGHIARSAISTFGNVDHYKYFLPRIFEVMSEPNSYILDDFTCFEKLNYGEWETWPDLEQKAIEHYFENLWKSVIQDNHASIDQIQSVFDVVMLYLTNEIVFNTLGNSNSLSSTLFIVDSVLNGWQCLNVKKHSNSITNWLYSNVVLQKLEDTFFKVTDLEIANRISITYTILEKKHAIYFS